MSQPPHESNVPVWDEPGWAGFPALDGDTDADVCVVGLGGSGLACIGELLRLGARVVGLDAGPVGGAAAGRNGGFLLAGVTSFHHDAVRAMGRHRALAVYRRTMDELDRMADETPALVRRVGSLRIADSEDERADCALQLATMRDDGLPVETYDGPEGQGLLFPHDAAFQPMARCRVLAREAVAGGARLHERTPATAVAGGEVLTPTGRVRCRATIVAVDGRLEQLVPELAGRVRAARLQMLATAPADDVELPRPVYTRWGLDYWQQLPDGRIALGGARDVGGDAEWTTDPHPTPLVQRELDRILRERVGTAAAVTHRWAATVGYTTDALPVAEEVRPGLWALGAYCGTGNVMGAMLGRAVARAAMTGDRSGLSAVSSRL